MLSDAASARSGGSTAASSRSWRPRQVGPDGVQVQVYRRGLGGLNRRCAAGLPRQRGPFRQALLTERRRHATSSASAARSPSAGSALPGSVRLVGAASTYSRSASASHSGRSSERVASTLVGRITGVVGEVRGDSEDGLHRTALAEPATGVQLIRRERDEGADPCEDRAAGVARDTPATHSSGPPGRMSAGASHPSTDKCSSPLRARHLDEHDRARWAAFRRQAAFAVLEVGAEHR